MKLFKSKKVSKNHFHNFLTFFPKGKKGMEMWQLILIFLAIALLLFMIFWYSQLADSGGGLIKTLKSLF